MNIIAITGRLTTDPQVRTSGSSIRAFFTIAVDRPVSKDDAGNKPTDFPQFVAFGKNAEVLRDFATKGQLLEIQGHIATSTFDRNGERQFSTELIVDRFQLGARPRAAATTVAEEPTEGPTADPAEPAFDPNFESDLEGAF
jgi:single-strand DNA-binding protein